IVTARAWSPAAPPPEEPLADRFLRLACLTYSDDEASDRATAAQLLADHPELRGVSLPVAAACSDVAQVRRFLAGDGSLAVRPGGPHGWSPLLYQAYARHDPQVSLDATLQTARLLLEAGADPNDGQLLYNRMFGPRDDHLVLLFEFGLGRDADGRGPWRRLLGDALESPAVMLGNLLWWAVIHDQRARVALLAANGVDVVAAFTELRYQRPAPHPGRGGPGERPPRAGRAARGARRRAAAPVPGGRVRGRGDGRRCRGGAAHRPRCHRRRPRGAAGPGHLGRDKHHNSTPAGPCPASGCSPRSSARTE
ncbi:hypothetical protein, partial [Trebonia sp.]|uniref:hypothetical protein n=1 Tax=Trebonia sp. TaxID=2767075 RepID=UPI0026280353